MAVEGMDRDWLQNLPRHKDWVDGSRTKGVVC